MLLSKSYYADNLRIAVPIVLSFAGQAVVQITDTLMVGRLGTAELGAVAFAGNLFSNVMVFGIGILAGLTPLVGASYARQDFSGVGALFKNALLLSILLSIGLSALLVGLYFCLDRMGQPAEVIMLSKSYYLILLFSLPPLLLFLVYKQCFEGMGNTRIAMYITLFSVVLNVVLNYMLIYGKWGAPFLGVRGAALASLIARAVMPLMFAAYVLLPRMRRSYPFLFGPHKTTKRTQSRLWSVGLPIAGQMVLEFYSLCMIAIMMGWIGVVALAANQVVLSIISFTFMISNGISGATTVLVSQACGLQDAVQMRRRASCGMQLSLAFMFVAALTLLFCGRPIARIFTADPQVMDLAVQLFFIVALFELFDGLQVTALGALRGITDVRYPMLIAFCSYICVCLPFAYLCGFVFNLGAAGILSGFMVGLILAAVLYVRRFYKTVRL